MSCSCIASFDVIIAGGKGMKEWGETNERIGWEEWKNGKTGNEDGLLNWIQCQAERWWKEDESVRDWNRDKDNNWEKPRKREKRMSERNREMNREKKLVKK